MTKCKHGRDLQVVDIKYSNYNDMKIKEVRINVDDDQYKILKHVNVTTTVDGEEVIEKMLEYKVVDDRMMYEMVHTISHDDLRSLIKALQQLLQQMK